MRAHRNALRNIPQGQYLNGSPEYQDALQKLTNKLIKLAEETRSTNPKRSNDAKIIAKKVSHEYIDAIFHSNKISDGNQPVLYLNDDGNYIVISAREAAELHVERTNMRQYSDAPYYNFDSSGHFSKLLDLPPNDFDTQKIYGLAIESMAPSNRGSLSEKVFSQPTVTTNIASMFGPESRKSRGPKSRGPKSRRLTLKGPKGGKIRKTRRRKTRRRR